MAIVTISMSLDMSIPANAKAVDDFCNMHGYTGFLPGTQAPQNQAQFMKAKFMSIFKSDSGLQSASVAAGLVRTAEIAKANTDIIVT